MVAHIDDGSHGGATAIGDPPATGTRDLGDVAMGVETIEWNIATGATGSDIVSGDLATLRSNAGDFSPATGQCVDDDRTATRLVKTSGLVPGQGKWFLVRGQNCGGNGSYDSGGSTQVGLRDLEIAGSGNECP